MKDFFTNKRKYILHQVSIVMTIVFFHYFFYRHTDFLLERNFYWVAMIILLVGFVSGTIFALGLSLLFMFVLGSYSFWTLFQNDMTASQDLLGKMFYWFMIFIVLALLSGSLHGWVQNLLHENAEMKKRFRDLVSIDSLTGFDNRKRFFFELEEEFARSERYGNVLSIVLIQVDQLDEFRKLYGQKETNHILQSIANNIRKCTRRSDKRFRISEDVFAVILTDTPFEHINIVLEKFKKNLVTHVLRNGKKEVTLSMRFGTASYEEHIKKDLELFERAKTELDFYIP